MGKSRGMGKRRGRGRSKSKGRNLATIGDLSGQCIDLLKKFGVVRDGLWIKFVTGGVATGITLQLARRRESTDEMNLQTRRREPGTQITK